MRIKHKFIGSLIISMWSIAPALAQDAEKAIEHAASAYAVDILQRANTIRLESDRRLPFESHDYTADFHDLAQQRFHVVLDIENQKGSHEFLTQIAQTFYHGRTLGVNGKSTFIAYGPDTYQDQGEIDFFVQFGSTFRGSDVLLAIWMNNQKSEAKHLGEAMWLGDQHDIVEVSFPNSPPLKIFIRSRDGAITKMERDVAEGRRVFYTFSNHEKDGAGIIAREHSFYIEDERIYFSFNNAIALNDPQDEQAFKLDKDLEIERTRTDQSEMSVRNIGTGEGSQQSVHQVGQGENCTTFMVMGDGIIGFGMGVSFGERLEAYRTQTGINLPLRYVVASDHHDEDIGGAADATEAGATLLITNHTAAKLRNGQVDHVIEIVNEMRRIEDLTILPLATDHAASTLVAYHETQKFVMQTGHYYSSFIEGPSYARQTAVTLYEALPRTIRDEAEAIISGQDMKPEKWSDFVSAIKQHKYVRCHRNRPICGGRT